ncbi:Hsp70 family protein [Gordonia sp. OPL2]|uniref:Hsp70 family protein n=1 Tax=Gordonia sp. OPL2 TaxID=2486274 RepID=UPI0016550384|nr:Hsp70 family protein [Gordonia sp. OPL2]RPA12351.1 Hsp70 family protein [Gordonia sp. OPL2]
MSFAPWTLAIDFGTSNSAAAHSGATSGGIEALSLSHTSNLMPSAVYVAAPDRITVGEAAVDAAQHNPSGYIASPKRLIGADPMCTVNGHTMPTYALVAAVLGAIIQRGKAAHAGAPPERLVLTHPEAWAQQQVRVLVDAATSVGIHPSAITTISEPRAAAAHYSRSHAMQPGAKIAVFDFGGGTLDIAVLTVTAMNSFQVIAARGDNGLGGKNLDALVQRWVEDRLTDRDPNLVTWLRRQAPVDVVADLQDSIRRAKELLSEAPSATITVPTPSGRMTLQITRDEFDELIGPAVGQALQLTRAALMDAGVTHSSQLTALYLTGGSSRIPLIQHRLHDLGPVATLDDPKTVVAQGALVVVGAESAPRPVGPPIIPGAGDLMPSWQGGPQQGAPRQGSQQGGPQQGGPQQGAGPRPGSGPQPTAPSFRPPEFAEQAGGTNPKAGRRWGRIAAIAVAAVAVIGITVGTVAAMTSGDGNSDDNPAPPGSGTAAADSESEGSGIITDENQLMALVPGPLKAAVTNCRKSGFSSNGALKVTCSFSDTGALADLGEDTTAASYFIVLYGDEPDARQRIVNIRNGIYSAGKGTLVENADRTSAAEIREQSTSDYTIDYANTATSLEATVFGIGSIDKGRTFLTRSGLIA